MDLNFEKYKAEQRCPNSNCKHYGKCGVGNIGTKSSKKRQVYCKECRQSWVITKGTFFFNLKKPISLIIEVLLLLSEGMGVNAVCRVKKVKGETVNQWILKAANHVKELSLYLEIDMHLTQCQIDEFWSFIYKKKGNLRKEERGEEDKGDRWGFVNVLPNSGFIHTVHNGPRNQEEADKFIEKIKNNSDGIAPLFLSDGWSSYEEALKRHYSVDIPFPYSGKGRPRNPIRQVDKNLRYAQVVKKKKTENWLISKNE